MWLKYYIVLNLQITFNFGLNTAKNAHPVKKAWNKSCSELNFLQRSLRAHMSVSPQSGARRCERLIWLKYYIVLKWQITFRCILVSVKCCPVFCGVMEASITKHLRVSHPGYCSIYICGSTLIEYSFKKIRFKVTVHKCMTKYIHFRKVLWSTFP